MTNIGLGLLYRWRSAASCVIKLLHVGGSLSAAAKPGHRTLADCFGGSEPGGFHLLT